MHRYFSSIPRSFTAALVVGITLLSTSGLACAATIIIYPIEDTYIDSEYPNDNYVGDSFFYARKAIFGSDFFPDEERIGLLRFDLRDKIRKGSTVNSATLRLMSFYISSATPHIGVYRYSNNDWDPVTVTWNNFPAGTYQHLSEAAIPYEDQYYFWNVSGDLDRDILSLAVTSTRTDVGIETAGFRSLNSYYESDRPVLVIDYTPPPVSGMPWLPLLLED